MKLRSILLLFTVISSSLAAQSLPPPPAQIYTPGTTAPASYQLLNLEFEEDTRTDKWLNMSMWNYQQSHHGYAGNALVAAKWNYSMIPNFAYIQENGVTTTNPSSSALFYKGVIDNGSPSGQTPNGYPAMEGIYTLFTLTPFIIYESTPLAGIKSISFQIYLTTGGNNDVENLDAYGVDGDLYQLPVLTLQTSGGEIELNPYSSSLYKSEDVSFGHEGGGVEQDFAIYENYRLFQWDLNPLQHDILSFAIEFATYEHVSLRSIQLDQSMHIIPEASFYALLFGLALTVLVFLRRRFFQADISSPGQ